MSTSRRPLLKLTGTATAAGIITRSEALNPLYPTTAPQPLNSPPDYTLRIATSPVTRPQPHHLHHHLQQPVPRPAPPLQRESSPSPSTSTTTPTPPNNSTGTASSSPSTSTAQPKRAPPHPRPRHPPHPSSLHAPSGVRFYHTHVRAGADLAAGQYNGLAAPLHRTHPQPRCLRPRSLPHPQRVRTPTSPRGGDMAMDFLAPATTVKALKDTGESAMKASLGSDAIAANAGLSAAAAGVGAGAGAALKQTTAAVTCRPACEAKRRARLGGARQPDPAVRQRRRHDPSAGVEPAAAAYWGDAHVPHSNT